MHDSQLPDVAPEVPESSLPDPGKPIVMTLKVFPDGTSELHYLGDPGWALQTLLAIAEGVENEVTGDAAQRP